MSTSPSSSVQIARRAIAERLKDICKAAGLNGHTLAEQAGWHRAKSSRIMNAVTAPSDEDIRTWCRICGAQDQAADLIAASRSAESMYVEWRRVQRSGLRVAQEAVVPLYERTRSFRIYCSNVVPGFLQTAPYASALLTSITEFRAIPNDVDEAVAARMGRAHILREGDHRFAFLVEETVLRYAIGDAATMAGQLGYLLTAISYPSVSLGVIPFGAKRPMWPVETFNIYDEAQVFIELLSASVTVTAPGDVDLYVRAFAEMSKLAVYGAKARTLITAAIESLR